MPDIDVLLTVRSLPRLREALPPAFRLHGLADVDALPSETEVGIRAVACAPGTPVDGPFMDRFPKLEIIAGFGVGYDHIDATAAAHRGIVVTNTPDVLTEEVADTAVGLMIMTARIVGRGTLAARRPVAVRLSPDKRDAARQDPRYFRPRPYRQGDCPARRGDGHEDRLS